MTAKEDLITTIRSWANIGSEIYNDALVESWIRMFEEELSESIRCKHMIAIDRALVEEDRVPLPADWLELDFVRVVGGKPLKFRDRSLFYTPNADDQYDNAGYYTITGNFLIVGGPLGAGKNVEISYYEQIPELDAENWVYAHYLRLYITGTLAVACAFGLDDERAPIWETATQKLVDKINEGHLLSKTSGSRLVRSKPRSF